MRPAPDEHILRDLDNPARCPDQTKFIMRRLGYVRVDAETARRSRRRRLGQRVALVALFGLTVQAAWLWCRDGDRVRRPSGPTVPAALHDTIRTQQDRWSRTIRTLQELTPAPRLSPSTPEPEEAPAEIDDGRYLAAANVRWL